MVKHPNLLYGFTAILGIISLTAFFLIPMFFPMSIRLRYSSIFSHFPTLDSVMGVSTWFLFSIVGVVFITAGICGIGSQYLRNRHNLSTQQPELVGDSMKHSKLYRSTAILGVIFLIIFSFGMLASPSTQLMIAFILFLFGGTVFLTAGVCGFGRQYFENHKNLFSVVAAILVPYISLNLFFLVLWVHSWQVT